MSSTSDVKLVIATPLFGTPSSATVHWAYADAMLHIIRSAQIDRIPSLMMLSCDLVRARSRAVRMFLESDGTHLLFWDSDVVPRDTQIIQLMIQSGKDVVCAPYPRKKVRWDQMAAGVRDESEQASMGRQDAKELEALSIDWTTRSMGERDGNFVRVRECGMGFTMMTRRCLDAMVAHFGTDGMGLNFIDSADGSKKPTTAIFSLLFRDGEMAPEDYSFCYRWRDLGGEVWMILDPASHIGSHVYGSTYR